MVFHPKRDRWVIVKDTVVGALNSNARGILFTPGEPFIYAGIFFLAGMYVLVDLFT